MTSPKPHLLLIDDDPNTLASLSRAFRLAGYEATVCDSAARALELIRAETLRPDFFGRGDARQGRNFAARGFESGGRDDAGGDDFGPGQRRNGGARHAARRRGFSGKAALHGKASGHHRKRSAAAASRGREPRPAPPPRQARNHLVRPGDGAADGAGGARRRERIARRDSGRNGHGQGTRSRARFTRKARGAPGRS